MIDFGGDAPGAYLPVAVVQLHFTSPQSQLLFGSRIKKPALAGYYFSFFFFYIKKLLCFL
ncbi:TPA: hypothetical protein ACIAHB_002356 [Escherichia coli]